MQLGDDIIDIILVDEIKKGVKAKLEQLRQKLELRDFK